MQYFLLDDGEAEIAWAVPRDQGFQSLSNDGSTHKSREADRKGIDSRFSFKQEYDGHNGGSRTKSAITEEAEQSIGKGAPPSKIDRAENLQIHD